MWSKAFWKDALERAGSTAAEFAIALVGVDNLALLGADGFDLMDVDVADVIGVSLAGFGLSILKSVAASRVNDPKSASLIDLPGKHAADR